MQNFGLKTSVLGKFSSEIEVLSIHNFLYTKFAALFWKYEVSYQKLATFCFTFLCARAR